MSEKTCNSPRSYSKGGDNLSLTPQIVATIQALKTGKIPLGNGLRAIVKDRTVITIDYVQPKAAKQGKRKRPPTSHRDPKPSASALLSMAVEEQD